MKYAVYAQGPADAKFHLAAFFNLEADARQYMAEFLADRPKFRAEIRTIPY